jgi:hypothetical protein
MEAGETIKATDLVKLMAVVDAAVALYNALERDRSFEDDLLDIATEDWFLILGEALRSLGLAEVKS